jgi:hypothetical protein
MALFQGTDQPAKITQVCSNRARGSKTEWHVMSRCEKILFVDTLKHLQEITKSQYKNIIVSELFIILTLIFLQLPFINFREVVPS